MPGFELLTSAFGGNCSTSYWIHSQVILCLIISYLNRREGNSEAVHIFHFQLKQKFCTSFRVSTWLGFSSKTNFEVSVKIAENHFSKFVRFFSAIQIPPNRQSAKAK